MITRVRYSKQPDGNLVSAPMQAGGRLVKARITEKGYSIVDGLTGEYLTGGQGSTPHKTKILIKKALKELGVIFHDEVRRKAGSETSQSETEEQPVT